jgi:PASTA domain-containing protein
VERVRQRTTLSLAVALITLALGCGSAGRPTSAHALTPSELKPLRHAAAQGRAYRLKNRPASRMVRAPDLVGKPFRQALQTVHAAGLRQRVSMFPGTLSNPGFSGRCVRITAQAPRAGTKVPAGSTLVITYGACPPGSAPADS